MREQGPTFPLTTAEAVDPSIASSPMLPPGVTRERPELYERNRSLDGPAETRRVGAKALLRDGERVLLVQERRADGTTFWSLPGGGREPGEGMLACLRREVLEELQCEVRLGPLVGTCTYRHSTAEGTVSHYGVFAGKLAGTPTPARREDIVDLRWVPADSPPAGTLAPFQQLLGWLTRRDSDS